MDGVPAVAEHDLCALDDALERAFASGDESGLDLLGYGEISCVLRGRSGEARFAGKRLPPFPDAHALEAYREVFTSYLAALEERGIAPVPSALEAVPRDGGPRVAWCIQPILPAGSLLPDVIRAETLEEGATLFARVVDRVAAAVGPELGLDAQLSNWALVDGELRYLDVTTPLMRGAGGRERLDPELFLASLPAPLRGLVRRFMLGGILDKYYDPRGAVLDAVGNLIKERLADRIARFLEIANARVSPPIEAREVRRYYADDARTWALLQRLRRLDRAAHRALGRPYPFLLPRDIER